MAATQNLVGIKIGSVVTLGTPHLGSVAADVSEPIQDNLLVDPRRYRFSDDPERIVEKYAFVAFHLGAQQLGPLIPGLRDLTTTAAIRRIIAGVSSSISGFHAIAADADANRDGDVSSAEVRETIPWYLGGALMAGRSWRLVRGYSRVSGFYNKRGVILGSTLDFTTLRSPAPKENDVVVDVLSAAPAFSASVTAVTDNHVGMRDRATAVIALEKLRIIQ